MSNLDEHLRAARRLLSSAAMMKRLRALPALVLMAAGPCSQSATDLSTSQATEAVDSTDVVQSEGAVFMAGTDQVTLQMSPGEAAVAAAASARTYYQPSSCVTATANGTQVTYVLDDCTGPFGLVHVTGTIVVDYSVASDGIHAHATSTGLMVNGATLDIDATAVYSINGMTRQLVVTTTGSGTGPRGNAITRNGNYTVTWDSQCLGLDGTWSTTVAGLRWSTEVSGFHKCGQQCPAAGGSITHTGGISGVTIDVTFDGSARADWTTSTGKSGTVGLFCTP